MQLTLRGVLTTTAFTHQSAPPDAGPGQQMRTNIRAPGGEMHRSVPIIQANSVKALIRREAAKLVYAVLVKTHQTISRGVFNSVSRGAASRTGVQSGGATYRQHIDANKHQFVGLFGGGAFMFHAGFRLERDLIPAIDAFAGLLPTSMQSMTVPLSLSDLSDVRVLFPRDEFAQLPDIAISVVKDVEASYADHMSNKGAQSAAKKSGEADKKDDLNNIATVNGISAGVPLCFGLSTRDLQPHQAGLLLRAVLNWANANALGGGSARGWGSFIPHLALTIDGKEIVPNVFVGDAPHLSFVKVDEIDLMLSASDDALKTYATSVALSDLYPDDIPSNIVTPSAKGKRGNKSPPSDSSVQPPAAAA